MADNSNKAKVSYKQDIDKKYQHRMLQAQGFGLVGSGIQSIAGGFLSKNKYDSDAYINTINAASARANANIVARSRNVNISEAKESGSKFVSTQINQMAQSGALVGGAGTQSMVDETDFLIQRELGLMRLERDMEKAEAEKDAGIFESQARYEKSLGKSARTAGIISGISSIVGAGASFKMASDLKKGK